MKLKEKEISLILQAIELGNNIAIGKIEVENVGIETIVSVDGQIFKCFPSLKTFLSSDKSLFKTLEEELIKIGFTEI